MSRASTRAGIGPVLLVLAALAALAGCGGAAVMGLTADDNNPAALARALALRAPAPSGPRNGLHTPMLFAVTGGAPRRLVAIDLASGQPRWSVDADVQSRIAVGGDFVVAREGAALVARAVDGGAVRWRHPIDGSFVGASADRERAYLVERTEGDGRSVWRLSALAAGSGEVAWRSEAAGALGAPVAAEGVVLVPFLSQWLTVLDARSGQPITRVRGLDEQISFVRVAGDGAFFGSHDGVFRLDGKAASGRRASSSYGRLALPAPLARAGYGADAYDPVHAGYSAADRTRVVWRAPGDGLRFADDGGAVVWFRFVFGLSTSGQLRWAYSQPRADLVATEHVGAVIAAASSAGDVVALDPATGAVRARHRVELPGHAQLIGGTFDAEGWAPHEQEAAPGTVAALAAIAADRDARFEAIQAFAVTSLAGLGGADVTRALIGLVQDERTPPRLRDTASDALAARSDPAGLPALVEALAVVDDYVDGTSPRALAPIARAVAALGQAELAPAARQAAIAVLIAQLRSPALATRDLAAVVTALAAIGRGAEAAPLAQLFLVHRADPELAGDGVLVDALLEALVASGSSQREIVRLAAEDGRSAPPVTAAAQRALAPTK